MIPAAELSSLASGIDELAGRLASLAEGLSGPDAEAIGPDLFEVERSLKAAGRRLGRLVDSDRSR